MADSDLREWIKSYNQKKDEIKQTQLYKEVYDYIKDSFKSGELFDQEIAKRKFLRNEKDRKLDESDVNLCIQEAIEQLEREHVISYHGMHHMRFPIYRVNSAEYIKEKSEGERANRRNKKMSKWRKEEFSTEQAHMILLNNEILKLQHDILQTFRNNRRIKFDLDMVKKVFAKNERLYEKEDIDYICKEAIELLLKNGHIELSEENNSGEQKYVVIKQVREQHRDEDYGQR